MRFERVRRFTDPLTEYLRMQLDFTYMNIDAGEDVRWVAPSVATLVGMPEYDFYVIDDDLVAVLDFDSAGLFVGARANEATEVVARHVDWRDLIWPRAVPHERHLTDFTRRHG